ncbi:MAG TPA: GntR family transcriptional regulator [Spirochaetota bacterium]|nr:GntR family transcriptional regulator [Spirochaetota bacterium]HPJ35055.1 GntR family transcriptional regulator [Spirochaetota bacterium]
MKFLPSATLSEQIAEHLGERITKLELRPGERIIETKITEELGVSQSPVREAIRILEKRKLVKLIPRHGTFVSEITKDFIESMFDIFQELVGLATIKTVRKATENDIEEIIKMAENLETYYLDKNIYKFNNAYFEWGLLCLKCAYDPILEEMILDMVPSIRRIEYMSLLKRDIEGLSTLYGYLKNTAERIKAGDEDGAAMNNRMGIEFEKQVALEIFAKGGLHFN